MITDYLWHPKTFHCISRQILENNIPNGGLEFPNIERELQAYMVERISQVLKNWQKPWTGMLIFRVGSQLQGIDQRLCNQRTQHSSSLRGNSIWLSLLVAYRKLEDKIVEWENLTLSKIKEPLRIRSPVTDILGEENEKLWSNLAKFSTNPKRIDLNYIIAHKRLPLAKFLADIKVARKDECRLCCKLPETQKHLFYECELIQPLLNTVKEEMKKCRLREELSYEVIVTHKNITKKRVHEVLSIYKQCIWQVHT